MPEEIISAIVIAFILRAGCKSPPAVNQHTLKARERFPATVKVSRSGVIPGPTVIVRMGEGNDPARHWVPARVIYTAV
ncbi:hypothetical protein TUM12370_05840 [Salmonella enterica subsp. enterica serovar Choleraesuis]|nr:hypothetical protein TUM12370_05840 [Salmonella enterica subsp. enterica serovar Choleraesuis]